MKNPPHSPPRDSAEAGLHLAVHVDAVGALPCLAVVADVAQQVVLAGDRLAIDSCVHIGGQSMV